MNNDVTSLMTRSLLAAALIAAFFSLSNYTIALIDEESYLIHRDDAFINFRAARNFHESQTPYTNKDEAVASTTSLFFVMLISPFFAITPAAVPVAILFLLSALCALATAWRAASLWQHPPPLWLVAAILLSPPFLQYGISAWEHVPQALLVTCAFAILYKEKKPAPDQLALCLLLLAFAFLMRADSALLIISPAASLLIHWRRVRGARVILSLLAAAACFIAHLILMQHFYDDFLPNSYYLKATGGSGGIMSGLAYISDMSRSSYYPLMLFATLLCWHFRRAHFHQGQSLILAALTLHFLYVISIGGDAFEFGRFFYATLPIMTVLFCHAMRAVTLAPLHKNIAAFLIILAVFAAYQLPERIQTLKQKTLQCAFCTDNPVLSQLALIKILRASFAPDKGSLGVFFLGTLPYYMKDYHVVDFLGKADKVIAQQAIRGKGAIGHNKWDFAHSLARHNVIAIPMSHAFYRLYQKDMTAQDISSSFYAALMHHMNTRRDYIYLSPQDLCLPADVNWGLYVKNSHARQTQQNACSF